MTIYEDMTRRALSHLRAGMKAREAWQAAGLEVEASDSARQKGCPRSAFVSLAENGELVGVPKESSGTLSKNAMYVQCGAKLLAAEPQLRSDKAGLWAAIKAEMKTERQSQNGVLDVLFTLLDEKALLTR